MAKLNAAQVTILEAFAAYKSGSVAVVRAFEMAISNYWNVDSCNPTNLQFFLNAAKRFPVLQKAAVALLKRKEEEALGYFSIKINKETGEYEITNAKDVTKQMKAVARLNVKKFIEASYTSLLQEKKIAKGVSELSFDKEASAKAIRTSIQSQIKAMLAAQGNLDKNIIRNLVNSAMEEAFSADSVKKAKADADKLREKATKAA